MCTFYLRIHDVYYTMLNSEQALFVYDNDFTYTKLLGVPGGGKTRCVIEKICNLKAHGLIADYNDYLVLTFSRRACDDFIKKGHSRDTTLFSSKSIRTIHSACSSILYHSNSDAYLNIATIVHETLELLKKEGANVLKERCWLSKKVIFVDEAQDISELQYKFVCELGNIYGCPVLLIGDPNQTIFQFQNGSDKFLLEHQGAAINLKINYRSNKHIVSFLNNFRPWDSYGYITTGDESIVGKKPFIITGEIDACLSHIWGKIISTRHMLHEIAIIAPIKLSRSYCLSLSVIANFLNQMNIPFVRHYQDSDQDTNYKQSKEICTGKINLYTIHGSKGLEFKQVFLCNFHFNTKSYLPSKDEFLENKYLWYVGMSRAMEDLYIYGLKDSVLFPTIYNCPTHLYDTLAQIIEKPYKFNEVSQPKDQVYSVKNFITTKTILDEDKLFNLHKLFNYTTTVEEMFYVGVELYEYDAFSVLYGMFMDEWMFFKTVDIGTYINSKKRWFEVRVPLPKYLWKYMRYEMKKAKDIHYCSDFINQMNVDNDMDKEILKIIQRNVISRNDYFEFCLDNNVSNFNQLTYYSYLEDLAKANELLEKIEKVWSVVLFQYQMNFECKYLLHTDFSNHFVTLEAYVLEVERLKFNKNTLFQIPIVDSDIQLKGVIDALDDHNVIYEFKFCQDITLQDHMQVFLYALIHYNDLTNKRVELWNLQKGKKYVTTFGDTDMNEIRTYIKNLFLHK